MPDRAVTDTDDQLRGDIRPSAPQVTAYVVPSRTEGYAQRSTIRSKLSAFVITLAMHLAALVGIMLHRSPEILVASPPKPLVVTLLPLARPPAEIRARNVQPRPAPKPPAPARPALTKPIAEPIVPDKIRPLFAEPEPAPPVPRPLPALPAPPVPAAVAAETAPVSPAAGNAKDSWEGRVLARLERFKRFPSAARSRGEQGVAMVRFRLNRHGRILSSSITHSSGNAVLDQEALATLARAEPLPPIPADRPDEVELIVPVEFFLHSRP